MCVLNKKQIQIFKNIQVNFLSRETLEYPCCSMTKLEQYWGLLNCLSSALVIGDWSGGDLKTLITLIKAMNLVQGLKHVKFLFLSPKVLASINWSYRYWTLIIFFLSVFTIIVLSYENKDLILKIFIIWDTWRVGGSYFLCFACPN